MKTYQFLLLVAFAITINQASGHIRASYMDSCDKLFRCDSKASLTCVNGTCVCIKQDEMEYDYEKNKCVVLAGERCTYTAVEILTGIPQDRKTWTEKLDCVTNATCNSEGYCVCQRDSYETPLGLCINKNKHGESCKKDVECAIFQHYNLLCVNGKCACNETDSMYDENQCVAKADTNFNKYGKCIRNANAQIINYDYDPVYGGYKQICRCNGGYTKSANGLCVGSYGHACIPPYSPCREGLACINGKCNCRFPAYQKRSGEKCISVVSGPCLEYVNGTRLVWECEGDSECRENNGVPECMCKNGYIRSHHNLCRKAFGSYCAKDSECDQVSGAKLKCYDGTCSCGDLEVYDDILTKCRGLVGGNCTLSREDYCIAGAYCEPSRNSEAEGTCRCVPPAVSDSTRRCFLPKPEPLMGVELNFPIMITSMEQNMTSSNEVEVDVLES